MPKRSLSVCSLFSCTHSSASSAGSAVAPNRFDIATMTRAGYVGSPVTFFQLLSWSGSQSCVVPKSVSSVCPALRASLA